MHTYIQSLIRPVSCTRAAVCSVTCSILFGVSRAAKTAPSPRLRPLRLVASTLNSRAIQSCKTGRLRIVVCWLQIILKAGYGVIFFLPLGFCAFVEVQKSTHMHTYKPEKIQKQRTYQNCYRIFQH